MRGARGRPAGPGREVGNWVSGAGSDKKNRRLVVGATDGEVALSERPHAHRRCASGTQPRARHKRPIFVSNSVYFRRNASPVPDAPLHAVGTVQVERAGAGRPHSISYMIWTMLVTQGGRGGWGLACAVRGAINHGGAGCRGVSVEVWPGNPRYPGFRLAGAAWPGLGPGPGITGTLERPGFRAHVQP